MAKPPDGWEPEYKEVGDRMAMPKGDDRPYRAGFGSCIVKVHNPFIQLNLLLPEGSH